nr:AAA family ATPase [uncultured Hyphomonas sp.]
MPRLVMMSGLPGSGKSTLSKILAGRMGAALLRIDVFEQDLRNQHGADLDVGTRGYQRGYRLAAQHLGEGRNVIADAVNAVEAARQGWRDVAAATDADIVEIEILCSDIEEVRTRLQTRDTGIEGLAPVQFDAVSSRMWEPNPNRHAAIDTAGKQVTYCADALEQLVFGRT